MNMQLPLSVLKLYRARLFIVTTCAIFTGLLHNAYGEDAWLHQIAFGAVILATFLQIFGLFDVYKLVSYAGLSSYPVAVSDVPESLPSRDRLLPLIEARARAAFSVPRALIVAATNGVALFFMGFKMYFQSALGVIVISFMLYHFSPLDQQRTRRPGIVFRRFSTKPNSDTFCFVVSRACAGLANPVTLQDSSFKGEQTIEWYGRWYLLTLFNLVLLLSSIFGPWASIVASLVSLSLWYRLALLRARSFEPITLSCYQEAVQGAITRITEGKSRYAGVQTLRFTDECWRQAVELALEKVEFAVIDITAIIMDEPNNESLLWEVRRTAQRLGYKRVSFVANLDRVTTAGAFQALCVAKLRKLLSVKDANGIDDAHFVSIPFASDPSLLNDETTKASYVKLTLAIASSLVAGSA